MCGTIIGHTICIVLIISYVNCQLTTDVLWDSCTTTICGDGPRLTIQCDAASKILISNITSGQGQAFDRRSYTNLRRRCLGMSNCDPYATGFCGQHHGVKFNVSYICVKDSDIDKCDGGGRTLTNKAGFITNPNYPSESQYRTCQWKIKVPADHYVHIFLHEISFSKECNGLIFTSEKTCGRKFPTFAICDETKINSTITACGDTGILLPSNDDPMRFWLSYYVVPVDDLRFASLYNVDIVCEVHQKDFEYSKYYYSQANKTANAENIEKNQTSALNDTVAAKKEKQVNDDDYGLYVGLGAGFIIFLLIIIAVIIYFRCRPDDSKSGSKTSLSISHSQINCSDIQKRPLPERQNSADADNEKELELQIGYSVVADELSYVTQNTPTYAPTYAEIEECGETGQKPKSKLQSKRSVDISKRELPAKPVEETPTSEGGLYSDIDEADAKDSKTEKTSVVDSKNKKNQEIVLPQYYNNKKKMSNASNIYAECEELNDGGGEKAYMDMSHKSYDGSDYVSHSKDIRAKDTKDKVNQSKRSQGHGQEKSSSQNITKKPGELSTAKGLGKSKKESVTSESDSDDDICMVENELYEPFESAKV